jgi:hypothetical protein
VTEDTCRGDCGESEWRFCPHCGRPLAPQHPDMGARRKPTVQELATLRAQGRAWGSIAALFGFASSNDIRKPLHRAMLAWYARSREILVREYAARGGTLTEPRYPRGYGGTAYSDYERRRDEWVAAVGLTEVERLFDFNGLMMMGRGADDRWLDAMRRGALPGPLPRWPEEDVA